MPPNLTSVPTCIPVPVPQISSTADITNSCALPPEVTSLSDTPNTMPESSQKVTNVAMEGAAKETAVEKASEISGNIESDRQLGHKPLAENKEAREIQKPESITIPKNDEGRRESVSTPSTVSSDCTLSSLNSSDERLKAVQLDSPVSTFPESLQISVDLAVLPERKKILQKAKWAAILTTPVRNLRERKATNKKSTLIVTSSIIKSDRKRQEPKPVSPPSSPPPASPLSEGKFKVGDVVWSKFSYWDLWPCQIKHHADIKQAEPGPDQVFSLFDMIQSFEIFCKSKLICQNI